MNSYILIWMPGSGKTTLGKMLAQDLWMKFIDFDDDVIEPQTGKSVAENLSHLWEKAFLELEESLTLNLDIKNSVFSCSWSLPLCKKAMSHLSSFGKIIYLKPPLEEIQARSPNMKTDRIIGYQTKTFEEIIIERNQHYQDNADIVFEYVWSDMKLLISELKKLII